MNLDVILCFQNVTKYHLYSTSPQKTVILNQKDNDCMMEGVCSLVKLMTACICIDVVFMHNHRKSLVSLITNLPY